MAESCRQHGPPRTGRKVAPITDPRDQRHGVGSADECRRTHDGRTADRIPHHRDRRHRPRAVRAMLLSDMGADVVRIDRAERASGDASAPPPYYDVMGRGRRSLAVDLKNPDGVETVLKLVETADGLIEGFRPGVMERLGLGPEQCHARNPQSSSGA